MVLRVFRFDASGCNGCDIEILSTIHNPEYAVTGIEIVDAPEKAEAMIVTGGGNEKTAPLLKEASAKLREPKLVIAMGTCAASMCVFKEGYQMRGPVDTLIPVNYFVLGCPPRPQNLAMALHALLKDPETHDSAVWSSPEGLRARISLDQNKCTACGACVRMCPSHAIDIAEEDDRFRIVYNMWKCSFCGTCQQVCPEKAMTLTSDYVLHSPEKNISANGEIPRDTCSACGKPDISRAQKKAIGGRILENASGFTELTREIQSSLEMCGGCKKIYVNQRAIRNKMKDWAYSGP